MLNEFQNENHNRTDFRRNWSKLVRIWSSKFELQISNESLLFSSFENFKLKFKTISWMKKSWSIYRNSFVLSRTVKKAACTEWECITAPASGKERSKWKLKSVWKLSISPLGHLLAGSRSETVECIRSASGIRWLASSRPGRFSANKRTGPAHQCILSEHRSALRTPRRRRYDRGSKIHRQCRSPTGGRRIAGTAGSRSLEDREPEPDSPLRTSRRPWTLPKTVR